MHLGEMGATAEEAAPLMLEVTDSWSARGRSESMIALARILGPLSEHPMREQAIGVMLAHVFDEDPEVEKDALRALFLIGWNPGEMGAALRFRAEKWEGPRPASRNLLSTRLWGRLLEARGSGKLAVMEDHLIELLRGGVNPARGEDQ